MDYDNIKFLNEQPRNEKRKTLETKYTFKNKNGMNARKEK